MAKYDGCYWCDNIIDHYGMIGLLYLGFPRCFILIRDSSEFEFSDFESWKENLAEINWLDPNDKGTPKEQNEVIIKLWNFSVEYDEKNEELFNEEMNEENF